MTDFGSVLDFSCVDCINSDAFAFYNVPPFHRDTLA